MSDYGAPSKWIWIPGWEDMDQERAQIVCFRREFTVGSDTIGRKREGCPVRVSADTRYKLYVNGELAELGPAKGDRSVWYYDTVDIGPYLREGENVVAAEVLHYPTGHTRGNHSLFRTSQPGFYFEELVEGAKEPFSQTWENLRRDAAGPESGGRLGITADANWHCRLAEEFAIVPEPGGFAPLQINESCAGNAAAAGWKSSGREEPEAGWQPCEVYNALVMDRARVPGDLHPRTVPYMLRTPKRFAGVQELREGGNTAGDWERMLKGTGAVAIPAHSREVVELSAGEEECGFLTLAMAGGVGARITILCSETYCTEIHTAPDGQQHPVKGDRSDSKNGRLSGLTDRYQAAGYGTAEQPECYEPFWFRTFRYVQLAVEAGEEPISILRFDYKETGYPLEVGAAVETSDASLAAVWDISLRTLRRCMHETYMDCPFYEQLQYAMDARSQILYTYSVSGDDRLARNCMEDFRRSQRADGLLNCSYLRLDSSKKVNNFLNAVTKLPYGLRLESGGCSVDAKRTRVSSIPWPAPPTRRMRSAGTARSRRSSCPTRGCMRVPT